jgi:hypothetical protein
MTVYALSVVAKYASNYNLIFGSIELRPGLVVLL